MGKHIEVHITCPSEEEGTLIARALIERQYAACVYLIPIRSFYFWEDHLCDDSEVVLFAKTKDTLFKQKIIPTVKSMHSYEVTEITAFPIVDADPEYLMWLDEQLIKEE